MLWQAPGFWWRPPGWQAGLLSPLARLYGAAAARRLVHAPRVPVDAPVLCVGNFTVGGTGKTPVAIAIARAARELGLRPGFLSRGHGGSAGKARLIGEQADAAEVGDEPLLLAPHGPVAVGADRAAGSALLVKAGCDFIVMDDGFQSARVGIDLALLLVDGRFGLGNGLCLPAGPLRAPLGPQLAYADAVVAMGDGDAAGPVTAEAARRGLPVLAARLEAVNPEAVRGSHVLAFAGIGHPEKFYRSLEEAGAVVAMRRSFPDHHRLGAAEIAALEREAAALHLVLATTAKDAARLGPSAEGLRAKLIVLEVEARFTPEDAPRHLVEAAQANWIKRLSAGAGSGWPPPRAGTTRSR